MMLKEFLKYLKDTCGGSDKGRYLLAVSGGVDSTVMMNLFQASGLEFAVAHCNFNLRGAESDGDRQFVESLAAEMKKPCYVKGFETASYASAKGISVQMAARDLRYTWFHELAEQCRFDFIATGHNRNDVVETALLNLTRGTGIRGLSGISPCHGKVIRPLLFASRDAILQYAHDHNLNWREDSSNAETKYDRNKIRHTIIPAFETINPAFIQNALETVYRSEETEKLLNFAISQVMQEVCTKLPDRLLIDIEKLQQYPSVDILLFELMREFNIHPSGVREILKSFGSAPGKQFHTRTHCITRDRAHLIITSKMVPVTDEVCIEPDIAQISYPISLSFNITESSSAFRIPEGSQFAALDAARLVFPLKLRPWKKGDRFRPLGMTGSKKISDFLINLKIPLPDKKQVWILETEGKIAWVVNHRIDDRFKITTLTRKILLIEYTEY
jgi:tRNA(Ile)-lysidine synthase